MRKLFLILTVLLYSFSAQAEEMISRNIIGTGDARYLKLDCSNDPLTGDLDLGTHAITTTGTGTFGTAVIGTGTLPSPTAGDIMANRYYFQEASGTQDTYMYSPFANALDYIVGGGTVMRFSVASGMQVLNQYPLVSTGDLTVGATTAGKNAYVIATLGADIAPSFAAANWTCTNGWSADGVGTQLTKVTNVAIGTITPSGAGATPTAGVTYKITIVCSAKGAPAVTYTYGGVAGTAITVATITDYITASDTTKLIISGAISSTCTITSVKIEPLTNATGDLTVDGDILSRSTIKGGDITSTSVDAARTIGFDTNTGSLAALESNTSIYFKPSNTAVAYMDSTQLSYYDNKYMRLGVAGTTGVAARLWGDWAYQLLPSDPTQRVGTLTIGVSDVDYSVPAKLLAGRNMIICDSSDTAFNFAHTISTNPTLFIHSAAQSTTQWGSLTHDGTDFVFNAGAGTANFSALNVTTTGTGTFGSELIGVATTNNTTISNTFTNSPAYTNFCGTGNRIPFITITQSATKAITTNAAPSTVYDLINGGKVYNTPLGYEAQYFTGGAVLNRWIRFDFGAGASKIITEIKFYFNTTQAEGTWKWQGSNDATNWTDVSGNTAIAALITTFDLSANALGYRYYQMIGVSGNTDTSGASWALEFEFKIDDYGSTTNFQTHSTDGATHIGTLNLQPDGGSVKLGAITVDKFGNALVGGTWIFNGLNVDTDTIFVDTVNHRLGVNTFVPGASAQINAPDATSVALILGENQNGDTTGILQLGNNSLSQNAQFSYSSSGNNNLQIKTNYAGDGNYILIQPGTKSAMRLERVGGLGSVYIGGSVSPTARLHLVAGTATAGTAPLKFTSGVSLITAELGSMEFTDPDLYFTVTDTTVKRKGIVMNDGTTLTATRVPFATTNGRLTDDASATYSTAGGLILTNNVTTPEIHYPASTPTTLSGDVNNYDLGAKTFIRLGGGAADRIVTGILAHADGHLLIIHNIGATNKISFANESASSTAANRIINANAGTTEITPNHCISFIYDATTQRWREITHL